VKSIFRLKQLIFLCILLFSLAGIGSAYDPDNDGVDELPMSRCASITIQVNTSAQVQKKGPSGICPTSLLPAPMVHISATAAPTLEEPSLNLTPRAPPA
jgi:hypothetical protein